MNAPAHFPTPFSTIDSLRHTARHQARDLGFVLGWAESQSDAVAIGDLANARLRKLRKLCRA